MSNLLDTFLEIEGFDENAHLLKEIIYTFDNARNGSSVIVEFNSNQFEFSLDFTRNRAKIQDVLDASLSGAMEMDLVEFIEYLKMAIAKYENP